MKSFTFSSPSITIKDTVISPEKSTINIDIIPGKYYFIESENYSYNENNNKINEIFVVHESFIKNNVEELKEDLELKAHLKLKEDYLSSLHWIDTVKDFDFESISVIDYSVAMLGHISDDRRYTSELLEEHELTGNVITVLDEGLLFNFIYSDFGAIKYSYLTNNGKINAFKFYTDSLENKYNRQFENYCLSGDLDNIKRLVSQFPQYIDPYYNRAMGFYNACREDRKNVIEYLLFSKDLKENIVISDVKGISAGFYRLCTKNIDILESLILDNNLEKNTFIENLLNIDKNPGNDYQTLRNLFNVQEIKNKLDKELNNNKTKNNNEDGMSLSSSKIKI